MATELQTTELPKPRHAPSYLGLRSSPHEPSTWRELWTDLDLRCGGVLEAQGLAPAPLLARLIEQHLAVALLVAPAAEVHPLPRRRVPGEEHPRLPARAFTPAPTTGKNQQKIEENSRSKGKGIRSDRTGMGLPPTGDELGLGEPGDQRRAQVRSAATRRGGVGRGKRGVETLETVGAGA